MKLLAKHDGVKASKILGKKSKARLVDWVPRNGYRGARYAQVELSASTSRPVKKRGSSRIKNKEAMLNAPSMDIDETLWMEEPVTPKEKRVSSPTCPSLTIFDTSLSLSRHTSTNSFLRLSPTCIASSILRVFRLRQRVRAVCLLCLNGGALTAFPLLHSARSAAEGRTSGFRSTEFRSGRENFLCLRGCGRLE